MTKFAFIRTKSTSAFGAPSSRKKAFRTFPLSTTRTAILCPSARHLAIVSCAMVCATSMVSTFCVGNCPKSAGASNKATAAGTKEIFLGDMSTPKQSADFYAVLLARIQWWHKRVPVNRKKATSLNPRKSRYRLWERIARDANADNRLAQTRSSRIRRPVRGNARGGGILVPSPAHTGQWLIFYFGNRVSLRRHDTGALELAPRSVAMGPHDHRRVDVLLGNEVESFAILFQPTAFYRLFSIPGGALLINRAESSAVQVRSRSTSKRPG